MYMARVLGFTVRNWALCSNKRGIGVGYYYSIGANQFAVSHGWSPKQLEELESSGLGKKDREERKYTLETELRRYPQAE